MVLFEKLAVLLVLSFIESGLTAGKGHMVTHLSLSHEIAESF
jgi:hypothetical protein